MKNICHDSLQAEIFNYFPNTKHEHYLLDSDSLTDVKYPDDTNVANSNKISLKGGS
jgi:hypothetical protein